MENSLLRDALANLLRRQGDIEVAGRSGPRATKKDEVRGSGCDLLLMDFFEDEWASGEPGKTGEATKEIHRVVIGMGEDYAQFLAAVRCGIRGYLLKDASAAEVAGAVRAVFRGEAVCPAQLCARLFQTVAEMKAGASPGRARSKGSLTIRQQKLMGLVARGLTNKEIAARLNLSEHTVKNHLRRIMKQVDAASRSQAVRTILSDGYALNSYDGSP